jgi:uncharacterized membrane protein
MEKPMSTPLKIRELISEETEDLRTLENALDQLIEEDKFVTKNLNNSFDDQLSFGDQMSDKIAAFGGSWRFITLFLLMILIWIVMNVIGSRVGFDPYPFILLNLVLSCVAALQAPFIMMSQNRQEEKDRLRAEHDYHINLKAEMEVRQLHMKIDQLSRRQWRRLLEMQQFQAEMLEQIISKGPNGSTDL